MGYEFDFSIVLDNLEFFAGGILLTLGLAIGAVLGGALLGAVIAALRSAPIWPVRIVAQAYVEAVRAVPLLVQLYIVYFALPLATSLTIGSIEAGFIGLTLYTAAYMGEIIRAGLESVPTGQTLAARALGFSEVSVYRRVVLPQAIRNVLPALGNQVIDTTLGSSLASAIGVTELTQRATQVAAQSFRPFEAFLFVGVVYLLVSRLMVAFTRRLSRSANAPIGRRRRVRFNELLRMRA